VIDTKEARMGPFQKIQNDKKTVVRILNTSTSILKACFGTKGLLA